MQKQKQNHQIIEIAELLLLTFRAPNNQVIFNAQQNLLIREADQNFSDYLIAILYNQSFQQQLRMAASTYLKALASRILLKQQFHHILDLANKLIQILKSSLGIKFKKIISSTLKHMIIKETTKELRKYYTMRLKKQLQELGLNSTNFNQIYFILYAQSLLSFPIYDTITHNVINFVFPIYVGFTLKHVASIQWEFALNRQNNKDNTPIIIQKLELLEQYFLLIKYFFKRDFKSSKEFYEQNPFGGELEELIDRTLNLDPFFENQLSNLNNDNNNLLLKIVHLNSDKISNHLNKIKRYALFVCESVLRNKFKRSKSVMISNISEPQNKMVMEYQNNQYQNDFTSINLPIIKFLTNNFARFVMNLRSLVSSTTYKYYDLYGTQSMKVSTKIFRIMILLIQIPEFQDCFRNFQSKIIYEIIFPLFEFDPQQRRMFIESSQMFFGGIDFIIDHNSIQVSKDSEQQKNENETFHAIVSEFLVNYTKNIHGVLPEIIIFILDFLSTCNNSIENGQTKQFNETQRQILWFILVILMENTKKRPDIYQKLHHLFQKEVIASFLDTMEVENNSEMKQELRNNKSSHEIKILNYLKIKALERYIFYFKPSNKQIFIDKILKMSLQVLNDQSPKKMAMKQQSLYQQTDENSQSQIKNVTIQLLFTVILLQNQHTKEKFVQIFNIFINQIKKSEIENSKVLDIIYEIFKQDKSKFIFQKFLLLKSVKEIVHRIQKEILQENDFVNRFQLNKEQVEQGTSKVPIPTTTTTIKISNKNLMVIFKCLHIFKIIASSIEVLDFINRFENEVSILNRYLLQIRDFEDDFIELNVIFIKSRKRISDKQLALFDSFYKIFNSDSRFHEYLFQLFNLFVIYGIGLLNKFHLNYLIDIASESIFISADQEEPEEQESCKGSLLLQNIIISHQQILDEEHQSQIGRVLINRLKKHVKYSFLKANLLSALILLLLKNKTMLESDMEILTKLILENFSEFQDRYTVKIFTIYMAELFLKYRHNKANKLVYLCPEILDKIALVLIKYYNLNCHGKKRGHIEEEGGSEQYLTGYYKILLKYDYPLKTFNQYEYIQSMIEHLRTQDFEFYNFCINQLSQKGLDSLKEVISIKMFETGPRLITKINRKSNENI